MSVLVYSTGDYFGKLSVVDITGSREAGFGRVRVDLNLVVLPNTTGRQEDQRQMADFTGELLLAGIERAVSIGALRPLTTPYIVVSGPGERPVTLNLVADVSPHTVRAIDESRAAGGGTELQIEVRAILSHRVGGHVATAASPGLRLPLDNARWSRLRRELCADLSATFPSTDATLAAYYRLAVSTLDAGVFEAAAFFVGGASERLIEVVANALGGALDDKAWKKAEDARSAEGKVKTVISSLRKSGKLDKDLVDHLAARADLYRLERNDVGHPKGSPPDVAPQIVEGRLREFPIFADQLIAAAKSVNP